MSESATQLSRQAIREAGKHARREFGPDLNGLCWEVNEFVGELLIDEGLPRSHEAYELKHVRIGPDGEERHYVCVVPGRFAVGVSDSDEVYVDAALTQFSDREYERGRVDASLGSVSEIPEVVVAAPGDEWRATYCAPDETDGQAVTPATLTCSHLDRAEEAISAALSGDEVDEWIDASARIDVRISSGGESDDCEASLTVRIASTALDGQVCPLTPARAPDPLKGVHDDLSKVVPEGAEIAWDTGGGRDVFVYNGRVSLSDSS